MGLVCASCMTHSNTCVLVLRTPFPIATCIQRHLQITAWQSETSLALSLSLSSTLILRYFFHWSYDKTSDREPGLERVAIKFVTKLNLQKLYFCKGYIQFAKTLCLGFFVKNKNTTPLFSRLAMEG